MADVFFDYDACTVDALNRQLDERLRTQAAEIERQRAEIKSLKEKTQYWPDNAERDAVIRHQKEEIESLCARLEMDPSHPYDGIYARDETIRGLEKEIARLRAGGCARDQGTTQYCVEAAKLAADNERLQAALEKINVGEGWAALIARAALEGK